MASNTPPNPTVTLYLNVEEIKRIVSALDCEVETLKRQCKEQGTDAMQPIQNKVAEIIHERIRSSLSTKAYLQTLSEEALEDR